MVESSGKSRFFFFHFIMNYSLLFYLPSPILYWRGIIATMCLNEYLVLSLLWLFISINNFCNLLFHSQCLFCCHCGFCLSSYCIFQQVLFSCHAVSCFSETMPHNVAYASLKLMKKHITQDAFKLVTTLLNQPPKVLK